MSDRANNERQRMSFSPAPIGLRDVLDGAPDVVFCCDAAGRWVWISPAIEGLVGYRAADLIGGQCTGLIAPNERRRSIKRFLKYRRAHNGPPLDHECSVMSSQGTIVRAAIRVNRIDRPDGESAYVGIMRRTTGTGASSASASSDGGPTPRELAQLRAEASEAGFLRRRLSEVEATTGRDLGTLKAKAHEADELRSRVGELEEIAKAAKDINSLKAQVAQLNDLKAQNAELPKLRTQVTELLSLRGKEAEVEEQRKKIAQLESDLDSARIMIRDKSEHLTTMSQEIRTPMNGVIGMAQLLLESELSPEQRKMVETVRQSSHSLLAIINDALEFSKIDSGFLELENIDFDLRVTIEQVAALLLPMATEKGLDLEVRVHHEVPSKVKGDPGRLRQVMLNLAGNAIKCADQGRVLMRVERVEEHDDSVSLRFVIEDSGVGLSDEQMNGLRQTYAKGNAKVARQQGAPGLALYVARQIVTLMKGQVGADSQSGVGNAFWFQVPLRKQGEAAAIVETTGVELRNLRVLIADPSNSLRQSMGEILKAWGARVVEAQTADEAMARLRSCNAEGDAVAVAIIDIQLPGMPGEQLGEMIRRDTALNETRTMLLTSVGRKGDAVIASSAGFSAYLIKPVPWSELYDALVEVARRAPAPLDKNGGLVTRHSLAEARRSRFRILLVEDDPVNRLVTEWALRRHGYNFESVHTAAAALETCAKQRFDLVLMDLQMPDMDGYKTAGALRARERGGARTPIVAMTGNALPGERERCVSAGMDDLLTKPIDLGVLCETVERWTHGKQPESAGVRAATAGNGATAGRSHGGRTHPVHRVRARRDDRWRDAAHLGRGSRVHGHLAHAREAAGDAASRGDDRRRRRAHRLAASRGHVHGHCRVARGPRRRVLERRGTSRRPSVRSDPGARSAPDRVRGARSQGHGGHDWRHTLCHGVRHARALWTRDGRDRRRSGDRARPL
jgi:PAS domain S-box-containing protein